MAARYVPPGRRNTSEARAQEAAIPAVNERSGIAERTRRSPESYSARDICNHFGDEGLSSTGFSTTLHASEDSPDVLAYVLLFYGANPRWATDHIIYVKSNLDFLHSDAVVAAETTAAQHKHEPIAVFEQMRGRAGGFRFEGWHKITQLQFLSPRSPELVRMLEQKWTKRDRYGNVSQVEREGEAWMRSLNQRWAVVKFEKDKDTDTQKGIPEIEMLPKYKDNTEIGGKKTVNELLQEMRIKDASVAGDARKSSMPLGDQIPNVVHARPGNTEIPLAKDVSAKRSLGDTSQTERAVGTEGA